MVRLGCSQLCFKLALLSHELVFFLRIGSSQLFMVRPDCSQLCFKLTLLSCESFVYDLQSIFFAAPRVLVFLVSLR